MSMTSKRVKVPFIIFGTLRWKISSPVTSILFHLHKVYVEPSQKLFCKSFCRGSYICIKCSLVVMNFRFILSFPFLTHPDVTKMLNHEAHYTQM